MMEIMRIPDERKGVLIGKNGSVKDRIEERTGTEIRVNDGVEIEGDDAVRVMTAKDIITAIGRGFSPSKALRLLDESFRLIVISLGNETKNTRERLFSRIIGTKGKAKRIIEKHTKTQICIYGKTVSVIGEWDSAERAKEAIECLLEGKPHSFVYRMLEERK